MKQPIFIRVFKDDKLEGIKQFQSPQIVIGANAEAQVIIEGKTVGPLHAVIEMRDSGYYISDLGSESGTRKNGQVILDDKLESGDEIQIDQFRLQFFIGIPKPVSVPQPVSVTQPVSVPQTVAAPEQQVATPPQKIEPAPEVQSAPKQTVTEPVKEQETPQKVVHPQTVKKVSVPFKDSPKTFAPPSEIKDLKQILSSSRGKVVEVVVAWKERILSSHHFSSRGEITIGSDSSADIALGILGRKTAFPLIKIGTGATIRITGQMTGELFKDQTQSTPVHELMKQNRLRGQGNIFELDLNQGEIVRLGFVEDLVSVYIRYVNETPKPTVAPLFDLTASEFTGVLLAFIVAGTIGLYMMVYAPQNLPEDEAKTEEVIRIATVKFDPPKKPPHKEEKTPELPPQPKHMVKVAEKQQAAMTPKPAAQAAPDPGKAAEVAPKETTDKQKKLTSAKPGGAIKTAPKEGANMKSEKVDPTKVGLLSVFGSKGAQTKLDKAYSGSGELQGLADSASGYAGSNEDRKGEGFGTKLKETGAGGKGTATVGIAGVGTKGKGAGNFGYGSGGLGNKGNVGINLEGQVSDFKGTMDREAIRRVILDNKHTIQNCYNMQLNRDAELYGKVTIEWTITEGGRVKNATVKGNTVANAEVANCIVRNLKNWKFPDPPPDTEGQVSFPFVFTSQ